MQFTPVRCLDTVGLRFKLLWKRYDTDRSINGFAVSALIDLAAVEVIDTMREAFRRKSVDMSIAGDEEDVEIALGVRDWRSTPAPFYQISPTGRLASPDADRIQRDTHAVPRHSKVGRNDPCPCGSGRNIRSAACNSLAYVNVGRRGIARVVLCCCRIFC
jgi:hypothetical protein